MLELTCPSLGPGVDPDHLGVALAPDPDPVHVPPPRDGVAPNPKAPLLRKSLFNAFS